MQDLRNVKSLLEKVEALSPSGFAIAFHIRLTSPDFMFRTYPQSWIDLYSEKGYVMVDPIVRWGLTNTGSIRWSELRDLDDKNILEQSHAHGMAFGTAIATDTSGSLSIAAFARGDREHTDAEIATLTQCVKDLHDQTASKAGMTADTRSKLNDLWVEMTQNDTTSN